jgi:3D (Asp-Asp-Asp) domain-containing protein
MDDRYWREAIRDGWQFYIEEIGIVRADDTGAAVNGYNRFDLGVSSRESALDMGSWQAKVWLVKKD